MLISDWSSDVCSSYLPPDRRAADHRHHRHRRCRARGHARLSRGDDLPRRDLSLRADVAVDDAAVAAAFPAVGGRCPSLAPRPRRHERGGAVADLRRRSEEHTSELQSLMRISYAVFCLKKKTKTTHMER